jgi:hypothetical protein
MFYDLPYLWPWLILTLLLGAAFGWRTEAPGPQAPMFEGWFRWALIALAIAFVLSVFGALPGRFGFWVETAVFFFAAYVVGGFAGGFARQMRAG